MFCGKCGAQNPDNAEFCANCGAKMYKPNNATAEKTNIKKKKAKNLIGVFAVIIVLVLIAGVIFFIFGGRSYNKTAEMFMESLLNADGKKFSKLVPKEIIGYALEDEGYDAKDTAIFIEEADELLQNELDAIGRYMDDWSYTYEIGDAEDSSVRALRDLQKYYESEYDIKVKASKIVSIEITVRAEDIEYTDTFDLPVIKIGMSWYVDLVDIDDVF